MSTSTSESRSLNVAQVVRAGGGTAAVELTVAAKLRGRGHRVSLFGPPEVREQAEAAGFDVEVLDWPEHGPSGAEDLIPRMARASAPWARQLLPRFDGPDLVVADCAAFGALLAAKVSGVRCAAVMPTVYVVGPVRAEADGVLADRASALTGINLARGELGLPAAASLTEQILDVDRLLVLASRAFELPEVQPPDHVRYAGPQFPPPGPVPEFELPAGDDPLVLISLSTSDQGQVELLGRLLAAVGQLPVRALVTLGPAVDPGRLHPPANAVLQRFVPHAAVLPHASLVVTHAGHGTVMAAVGAGVPLVCVPLGRDQPAVAARVTRHDLGIRIAPTARVAELRAAIERVLGEQAYRQAARRISAAIEPAGLVVDELESLGISPT